MNWKLKKWLFILLMAGIAWLSGYITHFWQTMPKELRQAPAVSSGLSESNSTERAPIPAR